MKREKLFLATTNHYNFRPGEWAEIQGLVMVTPNGQEPRICYHIIYPDFVEDYLPVAEKDYYNFGTMSDILKSKTDNEQ